MGSASLSHCSAWSGESTSRRTNASMAKSAAWGSCRSSPVAMARSKTSVAASCRPRLARSAPSVTRTIALPGQRSSSSSNCCNGTVMSSRVSFATISMNLRWCCKPRGPLWANAVTWVGSSSSQSSSRGSRCSSNRAERGGGSRPIAPRMVSWVTLARCRQKYRARSCAEAESGPPSVRSHNPSIRRPTSDRYCWSAWWRLSGTGTSSTAVTSEASD